MKSSNPYFIFSVMLVVLLLCSAGCTSGTGESTNTVGDPASAVSPASENLADYRFITEEFAPMNYIVNGELKGISVDLLEVIFENAGIDKSTGDIEVLNWPEAYDVVLNDENTVLFSMAKTAERENIFKWSGPIMENTNSLFAKKGSNIIIRDAADLAKYTIGAIEDTSSFSLLAKSGYPENEIIAEESPANAFTLLENGDIDMWSTGEVAGLYYLKEMAGNPEDYEVVYRFEPYEFYYAFNLETPDSVIEEFQAAVDDAKNEVDGTSKLDEIIAFYTGEV